MVVIFAKMPDINRYPKTLTKLFKSFWRLMSRGIGDPHSLWENTFSEGWHSRRPYCDGSATRVALLQQRKTETNRVQVKIARSNSIGLLLTSVHTSISTYNHWQNCWNDGWFRGAPLPHFNVVRRKGKTWPTLEQNFAAAILNVKSTLNGGKGDVESSFWI